MEVYLNNAATTWPKPECVYEAVDGYLRYHGASQGRGSFKRSQEATNIIENCRQNLARLFNVDDPKRFVFTKNCSEALNLAIKGLLRPGDHVVTGSMEHNSVWRPLKTLEQKGVISLTQVPCNQQGDIDLADVERAFTPKTRLLVFMHASNVTGAIFPAAELAGIAHAHNALFLLDAAQTAGVYPIDISGLDLDLLACSGHKGLLGPQGTGALYVSPGLKLQPLMEGGTGSSSLSPYQPDVLPDRFETGTPNGPGLAGLGAAIEFILGTGIDAIRQKEHQLTAQLLEQLSHIPGMVIYGHNDPDHRVAVVSFNVPKVNPEEVGAVLDEVFNVMVRTGLHCSPQAHRTIGTVDYGTVRVSPGFFNTPEEIDYFIDAVREIAAKAGQAAFPLRGTETASTGDFVPGYKILRTSPCHADPNKIRAIASLPRNVEELLPYLNAVLRGSYHEEGKTFTFSYEKRPVVVEAEQIILGKTENIDKVKEILDKVLKILNKVARERDEIVPSTRPKPQLSPYTIYKHLPRTNCKKCGEMTCLAFAAGLIQERYAAEQCPPLKEVSFEEERRAIQKLLDDYFGGQLPAGEEFVL
jgi:cysteine desulfurase/selenocysteine lyase